MMKFIGVSGSRWVPSLFRNKGGANLAPPGPFRLGVRPLRAQLPGFVVVPLRTESGGSVLKYC